jgi:uncharacterized membrane protein YeaQ/YmgE (transglycosylase-associated protein family)
MSLGSIIVWIIIGLIAGAIAGALTGRRGSGCLGNIIVGLLGAVVGGFLANWLTGGEFSFQNTGFCTSILVAAAGATVLIVGLRLITGNGRRTF